MDQEKETENNQFEEENFKFGKRKLQIKELTTGAILIAISIVLGTTGLGFIPLPLPILAGTIFHLPVIISGILLGPEIGIITGFIFGIFSWYKYPMFPLHVMIPGRLLIGITAYYSFALFNSLLKKSRSNKHFKITLSSSIAGVLGSLTNSIATLGLGVIFRVFGPELSANLAVVKASIPVIISELIIAGLIVPPIIVAIFALYKRD